MDMTVAKGSDMEVRPEPSSHILAKDLSQNAHRVPGAVEASEDVAAILALAERNLRGA
jgi:hypothetical protein